mmetsp:Transcript_13914/g.32858  ORF Transcript_13914/g.32858 Transcript_13914/m.32858 type:complete len:91 (+) Transcript_13914:597-869(+)
MHVLDPPGAGATEPSRISQKVDKRGGEESQRCVGPGSHERFWPPGPAQGRDPETVPRVQQRQTGASPGPRLSRPCHWNTIQRHGAVRDGV